MCGLIASFTSSPISQAGIRKALDRMDSRGPDGEGFWKEEGVFLGHRRLAIIDLDNRAAQPLQSSCGRYVIVFNGEIYNFQELRESLKKQGIVFKTTSDTEVILEMFVSEGEAMLSKLHGMFAFVIWDRIKKCAFAARDPYGIKPLYYAITKSGVILASQVKALLATGEVSHDPDPQGQAGFWMLGSVPEPYTWYRDIKAIPAGNSAWIKGERILDPVSWFNIGTIWSDVSSADLLPDDDVRDMVRNTLRESMSRHLVSDVPVGVFLSGGIDSGALVGLMVELGCRDLQGVTIAYDDFIGYRNDEAPDAALIAAHYGIHHHVRRVTQDEFYADLPRIIDAMDQPSIDGVNTWYASKATAERGLKVVVSGVGGDELFQGYRQFQYLPRTVALWSRLSKLPGMISIGKLAGSIQARRSGNLRWHHAATCLTTMGGAWWLRKSLFAPAQLSMLIGEKNADTVLKEFEPSHFVGSMCGVYPSDGKLALSQIESMTYLRNQLLRDADWASMDHSVELRTPLVDAHLLESIQSALPSFERYPKKKLLAKAPANPLPRSIIERRKTGFGIPVDKWLSNVLSKKNEHEHGLMPWARKVASLYGDNCI
jgi:asparagine synthase (glutamine-hydrolysing)